MISETALMKQSATVATSALLLTLLVSGCGQRTATPPVADPEPITVAIPAAAPVAEIDCCCEKPKKFVRSDTAISDAEKARRTAWLEPSDRGTEILADINVTDQDGRSFKLSELGGRPFALSFLYTRCTNRNKCPLIATNMGQIQSLLESEGLDSRVRLVIMTYDPEYDTPDKLKRYGLRHGIRFTPNVSLLQPDKQEKERFFDKLQVSVNFDGDEVNLHGIQLFLFDDHARFVRRYQSVIWDKAEVLTDLKRLADESK